MNDVVSFKIVNPRKASVEASLSAFHIKSNKRVTQ